MSLETISPGIIDSLSIEALEVFGNFPADVLEEIFVRVLDLPKDRLSASSWKIAMQICRQWHAICTSNTFWYKATALYFPEFVASAKHDPHVSFAQEFRRLSCQIYDLKTMAITWLNDEYWYTINADEAPVGSEELDDDVPVTLFPCKKAKLFKTYAKLSAVCWFDVSTYATVSYPCRVKLLICIKLEKHSLGPLNLNIIAGVKTGLEEDDNPTWTNIRTFEWTEEAQSKCPQDEWVYIDLGTVDIDNLSHGGESIQLNGQIFSTTGFWKNGIYVNHMKCIQLPMH